jgi:prevent-host-death family protein
MKGAEHMSQIRPVSDLRNNFADISRTVHETKEPVILTKNGYGDMVVLSYEEYERIQHESGIVRELRAAEMEAENTTVRYEHKDVMEDLRAKLKAVQHV